MIRAAATMIFVFSVAGVVDAQAAIAPQTTAPDSVGASAIQSGEYTNSTMNADPKRAHSAPVKVPRQKRVGSSSGRSNGTRPADPGNPH